MTAATETANLHEIVRDLAAHPDQIVAQCDDLDDLLALLAAIRQTRQRLGDVERHVEDACAPLLKAARNRTRTVDGLVTATWQGGKQRKGWRHEELAGEVVRRAFINPETGEVAEPTAEAWAARDALMAAAGISYWRATWLKEHDIPVDEFCESTPGRATVRMTPVED